MNIHFKRMERKMEMTRAIMEEAEVVMEVIQQIGNLRLV